MATPVLFGPAYSTYTRTARLAFEEKGVQYELREVDILKGEGQKPEYLAKHPWGKVPTLVHDGFTVYETDAITRYIDDVFPGPRLQPSDAKARARMNQIIAVVDAYGYAALIGVVVMQRLVAPLMGGAADEKTIAAAKPQIDRSVGAIEALAAGAKFLVGDQISLADLHLIPVIGYFSMTAEGKQALAGAPRLARWWGEVGNRPSVVKTQPQLG